MSGPSHPGMQPAEQAAAMLTAAGMPRMASRAMMALVGSPDSGYTAAELAERLGVSAGAVSGAVRYLQSLHMVHRISRAGDRRDRYEIVDDGWNAVLLANMPLYLKLAELIDRVAEHNDKAPASAHRAREMAAFFRFLAGRLPQLLDEWDAGRSGAPQQVGDVATRGGV